ncbi:MAG: DNA polymerase I [Armatimonadota bacterium]
MTNKQGDVTNAAYGFTMMLVKLLDEQDPEYLVVAMDMPAATFRHEAFEDYKAHRKPMPDDLRPQVDMMKEILAAMRVPLIGVAGFEADDVIGTLATRAARDGMDALIVTSDRDALQLVDGHVRVLANKKGITETVLYDSQAVIDRYGVTPEQLPDVKALTGDASDNIPGVPGIGEKTAGKLIAQYVSLEHLLEHVSEVKGKVGEALAAHAEQARQSKQLATIHCDVPLEDFTWESCHRQPWDQEKLLELFRHLDFRSLIPRLQAPAPKAEESAPMSPTQLLRTPAEVERAVGTLPAGHCAIVPVASGPDPLRDRLVGLALSAGDMHLFVPLEGPPPEQGNLFDAQEPVKHTDSLRALAPLLENPELTAVAHDVKALTLWLRAQGIALQGTHFDTLIAAYLIDPTDRHHLPDLALDFLTLNIEVPDLAALWRAGDEIVLAEAAGRTAQLLRRLETPLRVGLAEHELMPLFRDVEMPLTRVLAEMEWHGMKLDLGHLDDLAAEMGKELYQVEGEIYRLAGEQFTVNSPKQLQYILFEKLNLPKGRKTKTGYSTDADTLAGLADRHEIVQKILAYREVAKLKSTYVDALPRLVDPRDHIHTHFNQAVTATGRLSSSDPNLQNIPIRTAEGREIRAAFIPSEPGWQLLAADYSQIELRVLAHITGDEALIEVFRRGEDLHTATACRVFNVAPDAVTRDMRRMAKIVNFSIPYGTTAFGLAGQLGAPRELAEELMQTYLARFPGVAAYMKEVVERARRQGYVTTLLNRRRPLPDLQAPSPPVRQAAERTAINTPIQGSAADIMKLAMLHVDRALYARPDLCARLLLQVHDEVVLEMPAEETDAVCDLVRAAMRDAYPPLIVPLEVEVKIGPNWRDVSPQVEDIPLPPTDG